jgi:HSP20 family protein
MDKHNRKNYRKERRLIMNKKERQASKKGLDIDFGIGQLSLGGLFRGIEKLIDLAADLEEAGGEIKKEREFDLSHLKEGMKGVFGFSIKTASGQKSVVERFGNIKKTRQGSVVVEEERVPLTDVFDEKDEILIIAEIPGVTEESISLTLKGDILEISAVNRNRAYRKEVILPIEVKKENLSYSYNNGILEVRIKK